MADNKITISLEVEGNAKVEIRNAQKALEDFGDSAEKSLGRATSAFDVFKGVLAADAVKAGLELVKDAAVKLFEVFVTDGIKAASEQEDALNRLNTALALSGEFSEESSKSFQDFASEIQRTTTFSDEAILSAGGLIESLANLDEKGLQRATKAAVDMAAVLNIDLETAARKVGQAAEGNVASLKKFGIVVDESGTKSQTAALAIEALNEKFGGAAAEKVNTFSGALKQAGNSFNELQEATGNAIIQNQVVVTVIKTVNEIFVNLGKVLEANKQAMSDFVSRGVIVAIQAMEGLFFALDAVYRGFSIFVNALKAGSATIGAAFTGLVGLFSDGAAKMAESFLKSAEIAGDALKANFTDGNVFTTIRENLAKVEDAAQKSFQAMAGGAKTAAPAIRAVKDETVELTAAQKKLQDEVVKAGEASIKTTQSKAEQLQIQLENVYAAREQELITDQQFYDFKDAIERQSYDNRTAYENKLVDDLIERNQKLTQLDVSKNEEEILANQQTINQILNDRDVGDRQAQKAMESQSAFEKKQYQERYQAATGALNALATLQNAKTKEIAAVGKAAAIASTTISTYEGATKAYSALAGIPIVGPVLGGIAAAAFIAAGLANVAKISGVDLATGIDEVPPGFPSDSFRANLTSGERVVPVETNKDLKYMIADSVGQTAILLDINKKLGMLQNQTIVNIGTKEIVNVINDALQSGRRFAV